MTRFWVERLKEEFRSREREKQDSENRVRTRKPGFLASLGMTNFTDEISRTDWALALRNITGAARGFYRIRGGIERVVSGIQDSMGKKFIFDEEYRVVGLERDRLLVRGVHSGDVLTIHNSEPAIPLSAEEYPLGKLIAITDPSAAAGD